MKFLLATLLTLTCCLPLVAQSDEYLLPENKKTPVITIQSAGGFRMRPTVKPEPMLSIFPDGKVIAGRTWDGIGRAEWKLSRKQLQALLKFCIKENGMLDITSESIQKAIKASGKRVMIADAPSTEISIQTADKKNKVSVYALHFAKQQFKDIKAIAKVAAVEKRLKQIHAFTLVGGPDKLKSLVKSVNREARKKRPKMQDLTIDDVTYAQKKDNGTVRIAIGRQLKAKGERVNATVVITKGKPEISVGISGIRRR